MAVDAGCSELVSGSRSLSYRENAGKFVDIRLPRRNLVQESPAFPTPSGQIPCDQEQGMNFDGQGNQEDETGLQVTALEPVLCKNSADRLSGPPIVVVEDSTQPFMTHNGVIHVTRALPFLDQLI